MDNLHPQRTDSTTATAAQGSLKMQSTASHGPGDGAATGGPQQGHQSGRHSHSHPHHGRYRVYKRRWFGLVQLVLLNIMVSWDWLTFAPLSTTSAEFFNVSATAINWLSTGFLFAFVVMTPAVIWTLNGSPKFGIVASSSILLLGNWIRYGGVRAGSHGNYGLVMFGQILTGLAQPFVLAAPTRYSDLWFTERGRISATAVASLANPLGGALAQLICPLWASKASEIPNMVLYTSILATVICIPGYFVPKEPPTPPAPSSSVHKDGVQKSLKSLARNPSFWALFIPFSIYVGAFNAFSSLLNQILEPYGFNEEQAGICGAILIVVGLVAAAIISPVIDRTHAYLLLIRILVPLLGISYLVFIFAPGTRSLAAPYVVAAFIGATSFALVPIVLEYLVEITWPASPEVGSTVFWAGGQLLGGIFIVIMGTLKGAENEPPESMKRALIFAAVLTLAVVPLPLCLGIKKLGLAQGGFAGRLQVDEASINSPEDQVMEAPKDETAP